ncbi:site-2 protease. Metallo peptidase. MEROPS family M50B [Desulfacinum hydrothermale DSM 13146]|uniref:Zinc metalloprotease n=1 Tax=Desulfacinum hydrothermale DSM 13146 TaxID=1121390 RepID=A0A1W1XMC2_9BACT|nr:site-2 protease. Metallo peptidase. MEROPS family M50B [Desulfacinum hydrothermale DSM 13146]
MLTTILSTAVVLGVLIFVHELGHFLVARWAGVTVLRFSLGFGPRVFGIQRGETDYCVSAVPLGGYVKMLGEDPEEEVEEADRERSFSHQPVKKRLAIVLAGPLSNVVLAIVLFAVVFGVFGLPHLTTEIGTVTKASPAAQAGLQPGDKVLSINGKELEDWDALSETIQQEGTRPLDVMVERNGEVLHFRVTPQVQEVKNIFGEPIQRPVIGITAAGSYRVERINPFKALYYSLEQTWTLSKLFFLTIVKLIERVLPMETLGGPILIAQMAGQQAQEGLMNFLHFMGLISINLAILNLLPIPVLDGGHIFFFLLEAMLGRPISVRKVELAQKVGLFVLIVLMVFVFYNDIMRLLPKGPGVPAP